MAATVSSSTVQRLLSLYRTMARIRAFENAAEEASKGGVAAFGAALGTQALVRGPLHLSTGQEAVPAGVCANLERADLITSTHRGHGHTIAKGADVDRDDVRALRPRDRLQRRQGRLDAHRRLLGRHARRQRRRRGRACRSPSARRTRSSSAAAREIVACFFGDGAVNRGPFLEALNWAAIYRLPVLFVCEDNRFSATTADRAR